MRYSASAPVFERQNMNLFKVVALIALTVTVTSCASGGGKRQAGPAPGLQQPGKLLSLARDIQAEKGCKSAIPAYRVISSFGDGYDIAQYELGACLLERESTNPAEINLFQEEAVFWLRRAAWAGNARAQLKLAQILSGASNVEHGGQANPEEAMAWSILYNENAKRDLYDLPDIPERVAAHLNVTLDTDAAQRAAAFADNFEAIKMAAFNMPRQAGDNKRSQTRPQGQPGGQEQRRRRR